MNSQDKKTMKQVYQLVKELTPITQMMKDLADERVKMIDLLKRIEPYVEEVEMILDTEQTKYEDKSDKWKESEAGYNASQSLSYLETIHQNLADCIYYLEELQ